MDEFTPALFQSPLDRGLRCDAPRRRKVMYRLLGFNPLSIGAFVVTR